MKAKIIGEDGSANAEVGELCVKSPSLFKEYWKLPQVLLISQIVKIYLRKSPSFERT